MLGLPVAIALGVNTEWKELSGVEAWDAFSKWFKPAFKKAQRCIIFDIGANDGSWSRSVHDLTKRTPKTRVQFHVFEPQPRFAEQLQGMVANMPGSIYHEAAAWLDDSKNLTFFLSRRSHSASLKPIVAHHQGVPRRGPTNVSVRTVNLLSYLDQVLPPVPRANETLAIVKLDVESAEFELLPALLSTGVLCRVHMLLIEWHLNALPASARLAGLSLRLSLSSVLQHGCSALQRGHHTRWANGATPGPVLIHEGAPLNNWQLEVPGLWDVALYHNGTPVPGQPPSRMIAYWERSRRAVQEGQEAT